VVALRVRVPREFQRLSTAASWLRGDRMARFIESARLMLDTTKSFAVHTHPWTVHVVRRR
jgi:hypothetical protein